MSDDMNEKRQEKIEGFKLHINEESFPTDDTQAQTDENNITDESFGEAVSRRNKIENFKVHIDDIDSFAEEVPQEDERTDYGISQRPIYSNFDEDINSSSILQNIDQSMIIADDDLDNASDSIQSYSANVITKKMTPAEKKELKKAKDADKKRLKAKSRKNKRFFRVVWVIMAALISILVGGYMVVGVNDMLAVGRSDEEVTIDIPSNASFDYISDILYKNNIINNKSFFNLYATMTKSKSGFIKGTYDINKNLDYQAIISYLQTDTNRTDIVSVQFTEGMNVREFSEVLEKNGVCSSAEFLNACNSDNYDEEFTFLKEITNKSERYYKLEGYLFPDTYYFYKDEKVENVMRKLLNNYELKVYHTKSRVDGFDKRVTIEQRAKAAGMTVDEIITLASIIQAEAADVDDMYLVSSVLHNRLNTAESDGVSPFGDVGMTRLQVDSTVYYPYKSKTQIPIAEKNSFKSRYDTYDIEGLPAGAICNPGKDAIDAALSPDDTNYYFFCHKAATTDSPAQSYYASTGIEHESNLVKAGLTTTHNQ